MTNKTYKNLIIAHRGVHDNITVPENSMKAFQKAIEENLPIELDIQLTKDNLPVIFHDENAIRMTNQNVIIEELTFEELQKLTLLNTKEKIPTFKEVLELINGKVLLDIELKPTKRYKKIVSIVKKELENYSGPVLLKSFSIRIVKELKRTNSPYSIGLLVYYKKKRKLLSLLSTSKLPLIYCKPDFLAVPKEILSNKNVINYQKNHPIFVWTIKSKEELLKYQGKDIIHICNNLPY